MRIAFILPDKEMPWDSIHQGIGYVAAYAKQHCDIVDLQVFRTFDKTEDELHSFLSLGWDIIGISLTTPMIKEANVICEKIKQIATASIVVGGAEVTSLEEKVFGQMPLIDYGIMGEGEITFFELLQHLKGDKELAEIDGLIYRSSDSKIFKNKKRAFMDVLAQFPPPDRTIFHYDYNFHSIIGTRGCPFHCTFCNSSSNWRHRYRVRPPQDVYDEIQRTIELYGRDKYFAFNDDAFNINKKWVVELCHLIEKLDVRIWIRGIRAGLITKEVADALKSAGCFGVACGVESADNNALRVMRKATTIEDIVSGVEIMKASGIRNVTGQFIIGNQGDTLETVKKSIECSKKYFTEATFGVAYAIPHTFLYNYVEENNYFLDEAVPVKYKGEVIDWISFDTPHFPLKDRLRAVDLAIEAKVYHNIDYED